MTTRRCPALKMPKPAAMLCGYGTESMAFFQMPDNVCRADLAPQSSPTALVSVSGGSISSSIVEAEVAKIAQYQQQWMWEAIPHGQNAFIMSFPSDEVLLRVTGFTVFIKSHNVTLEFKACHSEEIPNRLSLFQFGCMYTEFLMLSGISWVSGQLALLLAPLLTSTSFACAVVVL